MPPRRNLDLAFVRDQFPPLSNGWAFFENAGGAYAPRQVIDRMTAYMTECQVQPGAVGASGEATRRLDETQGLMAALVNAAPDEIVLGHSTTINVYVLAQALRDWIGDGEVIVTNLDHEANNTPWRRLGEHGARIREWRFRPEDGGLHVEDLGPLLSDRTKLVAFSACSNITGAVSDVAAIAAAAHEVGALVCVDAVALMAHRLVDVKALDVDFLVCSLYKLFGPHVGLMYGKRDLIGAVARNQNHYFFGEDAIPKKLNPGGLQHELVASASGIVDYLEAVHAHHEPSRANDLHGRLGVLLEMFADHESATATPLLEFLGDDPRCRLLGDADLAGRAPTFAFDVPGHDLEAVQQSLAAARINIGHSHFYAPRAVEAYEINPDRGALRASLVHYNDADEVARLIAALDQALSA